MRTYLVTGGAGFIGSNYIHYMFKNPQPALLADGESAVSLYRRRQRG